MSILVTGGAGYIGSHTALELIKAGHDVVIVDSLVTGYKKAIHAKARFYEGDIRDFAFLDNLFKTEKVIVAIKILCSEIIAGHDVPPYFAILNIIACHTTDCKEKMRKKT